MSFPATRETALERLRDFSQSASQYHSQRNFVIPGHHNVSRLSPAIRHGLITEEEVTAAILSEHEFPQVEKFIQEVYWRKYWKSWLHLRPAVWHDYRSFLEAHPPPSAPHPIVNADSDVAIMNYFVRELKKTGYLHNHARMWLAAYWVHDLQLPWQWGADFFYRHLLDADPASNTLSWRWVAGLHTPGKSYQARSSNIKKFLHADILRECTDGLSLLTGDHHYTPTAENLRSYKIQEICKNTYPQENVNNLLGIWVHEENLCADLTLRPHFPDSPVILMHDAKSPYKEGWSHAKKEWTKQAIMSTAHRIQLSAQDSTPVNVATNLQEMLLFIKDYGINQIITTQPEVGYLADHLPHITETLAQAGVSLTFFPADYPQDQSPVAKAGFFGFWKQLKKAKGFC